MPLAAALAPARDPAAAPARVAAPHRRGTRARARELEPGSRRPRTPGSPPELPGGGARLRPVVPDSDATEGPPAPVDPDRLARLRAGDPAAVEAALHELLPGVRRLLHRLLGPRAELDDATQDALVAIAGALPRFEGRASLTTLAHRITLRTAYRYFRRRPETPLASVPPPADDVDPEAVTASRRSLERLRRCLDKLPEKRRVAFVLCCVEGLTPTEAAALEDTSAVTMRSRLMRARQDVARLMKGDPFAEAAGRQEVPS